MNSFPGYIDVLRLSKTKSLLPKHVQQSAEVKLQYKMISAVVLGSVELVEECIQAGANVNLYNSDGPLLHRAIAGNHAAVVSVLLKSGANPNTPDNKGCDTNGITPLQLAVAIGNPEIVKALLEAGADIHFIAESSKEKDKILNLAGATNEFEMARALQEFEEKPLSNCLSWRKSHGRVRNDDIRPRKETILHEAVKRCNQEMVQVLLDHGAHLQVFNHKGENALCYALRNPVGQECSHSKLLELLLSRGAKILHDGPKGENLSFKTVLQRGTLRALKLFLTHGIKLAEHGDEFPLHLASENNQHVDVVQYLLDTGIYEIEEKDSRGATALHRAVLKNAPNCVSILLQYGADPNSLNKSRRTPLCVATIYGQVEPFKLLLEYGAQLYEETWWKLHKRVGEKTRWRESLRSSAITTTILIKHIALLKSRGQRVHPDDLSEIARYPMQQKTFDHCEKELELLKNSSIYETFTFYDVLTCKDAHTSIDIELVLKAVRNSGAFWEKFPNYSEQLSRRLVRLKDKYESTQKALDGLNRLVPFDVHVAKSIAFLIMSHLRIIDLKNLSKIS